MSIFEALTLMFSSNIMIITLLTYIESKYKQK